MSRFCLCRTNLCPDCLAQVNGIFQPLLSSRGGRVHAAGPRVGISRRRGAPGRGRPWPQGLGTLLLRNGVLKHTLINCSQKKNGEGKSRKGEREG